MMKERTKRYVATVKKDAHGDFFLKAIRKIVKFLNAHIDHTYYVKCHGRFGKNNPNIERYRMPSGRINYRECRLEDSQRLDIYIYQR